MTSFLQQVSQVSAFQQQTFALTNRLDQVELGTDRADVETKLRRLARLLQDNNGATKIVANYSDGSSVFLEAHYVGGAETQFGSDATNYFCRWVIQMQAPQPYWATVTSQSFTVGSGSTGRGLLPQLTVKDCEVTVAQ